MGHVRAQIEFVVLVDFYLSYFIWLGCVGAWFKFAMLVLFLVSCVGDQLKLPVIFFFIVYFCVYHMTFTFFLGSSLSNLSELESCWGTDLMRGPWRRLNV